jgi:hemoglobin-like flavoprotein
MIYGNRAGANAVRAGIVIQLRTTIRIRHGACLESRELCSEGGSMNDARLKGLFRRILTSPAGLTDHQQQLIRASFENLLPVQETATALFCGRLSALDPELGVLFKDQMKQQSLMAVMGTVVDNSRCLRGLFPALRDLGRRQDGYGVVDRDYDTVAAALIWTLEQALGADFTAETRKAWMVCYRILSDEMKFAASESKAPFLPPC